MPIARCEIRNEYGLADPELYRTADKDDPEALLESVAMAGLVGVLRQLGDLAEFAAEIFHNLHEDVMATAARGHGLMVRVQLLETEIPSIEKAFLSQTDHSSYFYHAGVDWHPNLRLDQNLITQGDLPRFIMDSYEECRAPPRLFLLDKFDVAGAGACLKRYTNPSFFKVETSEIISADVQREKKIRKIKKKVPRWRNEETPEFLSTHAKLHQLFLEERVESGIGKHAFHAKLKRRLNGFPFDSKTGKSYMEILLKSPSPDHKVLHEVTANSSPLATATDDHKDSGIEIFEFRQVSPPASLDGEENMLNHSMNEPNKPPINDKLWEVLDSYPSIATDGISSALDDVKGEKVVSADAEGDREESFTGYQSDDIASEMDNFVDAPSNMESEMDGDSGFRMKSDIATSSHIKNESSISDADEEHLHTRSSDSQSSGDSTISDNVDNSSTKEMSSFSSDSASTSVENPQAENSTEAVQCAVVTVNEIVDASTYQKTANEDFQVGGQPKSAVIDDTCTKTNAFTNHRSEFEQLTSSLCTNGSIPALAHSDSEDVTKGMLKAPASDETVTTLEGEQNKENLVLSPINSSSLCRFEPLSEDDSPEPSAGEHLADEQSGESPPCLSAVPDIYCHTADSSGKTSSDSLHEDESDGKDRDSIDDVANTSDVLHDLLSNSTPENILSENLIPGKSEDEFPEVPGNSSSNYHVTAHNGDNIELAVSKEDSLINVLEDEDSNGSIGSSNKFLYTTEASLEKKFDETSLINAQTVNVENDQSNISTDNQISSDNLKLSHLANSPYRMMEGFDAHAGDILPEEEMATDETLALETLEPCEAVGSQDIGVIHHVLLNDLEDLESPCHTQGDLEQPAGTSGSVEMDGISVCVSSTGEEVAEISGSSDLKSVVEVHELLDKSDSEADKSIPTNTTSAVSAVSDNASLDKLVEEHNNCCMDELEKDENHPSECHGASNIVEKVVPKGSASGFETVFSNAVNYDHSKSAVPGTFSNIHLDSEVNHSLKTVHAATIESPVEQYGVNREEELFKQSGLENNAPDSLPLLFDSDIKESIAQVKTGFPLSQLEQDLLHPGEITSVSLPLPINHQQIIGYPKDQSGSFFPAINPFSETNQINLSNLPPLPPLPPVEWRMGKFQHALSSTDGEIMRPKEVSPQLISPLLLPSDSVSSPPGPTSTTDMGSSPQTVSANDIDSSLEEIKHSPVEISPETISKEENVHNSCSSSEVDALHGYKEEEIVKPISESVSTSPAEEDGAGKDGGTVKLPRPHNPLIEDVAVLDKSKLRKVTERVRPEIQKVDERDSLLEQIRTKSFNLKPAMSSRPSIRGPNTNLKVVAILEKANAIRQAFAGSDDDDSDSWSDS